MANKTRTALFFLTILVLLFAAEPLVAQTTPPPYQTPTPYKLLAPIPLNGSDSGVTRETTTAQYIPGLIKLVIALAGVLAVLRLIFAGIKYMSTDAFSGKSEAKNIIENALWGLFLTMSAWLILYTLNPKLVEFNLTGITPQILSTSTAPGIITQPGIGVPGPGTGRGLTQQQAMDQLRAAQITLQGAPLLAGVQQKTIDEVINFKRSCGGCDVVVNSATGGSHASGVCSHANGWKIDIDDTSSVNNYITRNFRDTGINRRGDNARLYTAPSGATYARESNHWDIVVPCT